LERLRKSLAIIRVVIDDQDAFIHCRTHSIILH
jgi:hypothetical protein